MVAGSYGPYGAFTTYRPPWEGFFIPPAMRVVADLLCHAELPGLQGLDGEVAVGDLHLFQRHDPVLGIEWGGLEFDGQTIE
jgi:hypothetical protein